MRNTVRRFGVVARMSLEADRALSIKVLCLSVLHFLSGTVIASVLLKLITNAVVHQAWPQALTYSFAFAMYQGMSFAIGRLYGRQYPVLQERNREHYDRRILELTASIAGIEHYENPKYLDELQQLRFQPQALAQMLAVTVQATSLIIQTIIVLLLLANVAPHPRPRTDPGHPCHIHHASSTGSPHGRRRQDSRTGPASQRGLQPAHLSGLRQGAAHATPGT